jgi:hypothetical protein
VKPLKQPVCHAIFHARAGPVFRAFLEEKFLLESFCPTEKPILSLRIPIPELGSTFAGTGTFLRIDARGARLACEAGRRDNKGVKSPGGARLPHGLSAFSWTAAPIIVAYFLAQRLPSRCWRSRWMLPRSAPRLGSFSAFPDCRPDKVMRLARPLRKFRSLALPVLVPIRLFLCLSAFSLAHGLPDVASRLA